MDKELKNTMPALKLANMTMEQLIAAKEAGLLGNVIKQEVKEPFPKEVLTQHQLNVRVDKLFESLAKSMWLPIVQEVMEPSLKNDPTQSKYFGSPWLYLKEDWPLIDNEPALFVLQLNIASLPKEMANKLGGKGLLQFFYHPNGEYPDESYVRIVDTHKKGKTLPQPKIVDYVIPNEKVITGWKEVEDYPHVEDLHNYEEYNKLDYLAQINDLILNLPECYYGDKLGGYPAWAQASNGIEGYIYQLNAGCFNDSECMQSHAPNLFASDGTGHIFISEDEEELLNSEGHFDWACG